MKVARERGSTVITISDVEDSASEGVEVGLDCAWKSRACSCPLTSTRSTPVSARHRIPEPGGLCTAKL